MKFHDCSTAPSPRRVRLFIAEKGLDIETVQVDLRNGEQFSDAFRKLNPHCTVPVLELDDGTTLLDSMSICLYLEETHPEPNLLGRDPKEKAVIAMWQRTMEWDGFAAAGETLRNTMKGFKNRALAGPLDLPQIPALAERGRRRLAHFFETLDAHLVEAPYVAGERFTVADITALVTVDFAARVKLTYPDTAANLKRWHDDVSARPSAAV